MLISHEFRDMNSGHFSLLSSSMRQGNGLEEAGCDQAHDDPFCYRCIIICATQLVGNPCQSMAGFFFIALHPFSEEKQNLTQHSLFA